MTLVWAVIILVLQTQERGNPPRAPGVELSCERTFRGRIVLFDWSLQWLNAGGSFVVRTMEQDGKRSYVRIVSFKDMHAPKGHNESLNPLAFVGKGPAWTFCVGEPRSAEATVRARRACEVHPDHPYEVADEKGRIPRYIRTPGAEEDQIPSLGKLPCYVLEERGLIAPSVASGENGNRDPGGYAKRVADP